MSSLTSSSRSRVNRKSKSADYVDNDKRTSLQSTEQLNEAKNEKSKKKNAKSQSKIDSDKHLTDASGENKESNDNQNLESDKSESTNTCLNDYIKAVDDNMKLLTLPTTFPRRGLIKLSENSFPISPNQPVNVKILLHASSSKNQMESNQMSSSSRSRKVIEYDFV